MKKFPPVTKDKESGLPKKYVAGLSTSTAKARAAHWKKAAKFSDSDPRAYKPAPGDATAKTKLSKYTKKYHQMFGEQIGIVIEGAPEKIEGTNCANCIHWVKESEKPVDKNELNEYGGLKAPNEAYVEMSKHVDLVTLPGKAVVKVKAYCNHEDIHDFVTERMCCAYWDGEGVKREFKGVSPKMDESVELDETIVKVDGKYRLVSKKTGRNLGTYDTKAGAMKRERQVQYFKHMGEEKMADYKPKVGDRISTIKGGQNTGKVEKVEGSHVYFRSDYKRSTLGRGDDYYPIFKTHVSNVRLHEGAKDWQKAFKTVARKNLEKDTAYPRASVYKLDQTQKLRSTEHDDYDQIAHDVRTGKRMKEEVEQVDEVKAVKVYDKEGRLVGRYRSMDHAKQMKPGHTYKVEEEAELDEGKLTKALAVGAMSLASMGAKAHTDTTKSVAQLAKERPALAQRLQDIGATGQVPASDKRAAELQRKQDQEMPASERRAKELKKEDVELDETNMRFDYEAAARPKSSDVKNFLNRDKNPRAAAASKKYIRRMTKLGGLGPNQTKKDTEAHMKAHFEEVEQVDEAAKTKKEKLKALLYRDRSNVREFGKGAGLTDAQKAAARKAIANEEVEQIDEIGNTEKGVDRLKKYVASDRSKVKIKDVLDAKRSADPDKAIEKLAKRQGYKSKALKKIRAFDAAKNPKPKEEPTPLHKMVYPSDMKYHGDSYEPTGNVIKEGFLSFLRKKKPTLKKPAVSHKQMRAVFSNIERQTRVANPPQRGPVIHRHTVAAYESVEQIDERNKENKEKLKNKLRTIGVNAAITNPKKIQFGRSALTMGRDALKKLSSAEVSKASRYLPRVAEQMTDNAAITKKTERERRIRDTRVIHHQNRHIHQAAMGTMEESAGKSLADKARKSGVSLATLRKVYNRGVAAWNSGHRPGTTPQQWGHARVNSYITKGKTYHTADKDLRRESVDVNEAFEREFGDK